MHHLRAHCLTALASVVLVGCGEDPIAPGPDTGPVTAYIDDDAFIADSADVTRSGQAVTVTARGAGGRSIEFTFDDFGAANYFVGPGNPVSASVTIGSSTWTAEGSTGSATVTVTAIWATHIEGSFVMTVVGGGSPSVLEVTNGLFFIDFF